MCKLHSTARDSRQPLLDQISQDAAGELLGEGGSSTFSGFLDHFLGSGGFGSGLLGTGYLRSNGIGHGGGSYAGDGGEHGAQHLGADAVGALLGGFLGSLFGLLGGFGIGLGLDGGLFFGLGGCLNFGLLALGLLGGAGDEFVGALAVDGMVVAAEDRNSRSRCGKVSA